MNNENTLISYIHNPFPLWNEQVASLVVDYKWNTSLKNIFVNNDDYSITGCLFGKGEKAEKTLPVVKRYNKIQLAFPAVPLFDFYNEHGLIVSDPNVSFDQKIEKINKAINILGEISPLLKCISKILRSIQLIEAADEDFDISYSHPDIPFSIFFSLCKNDSIISDLRVAESILHESMHLMLTLIEARCTLVDICSKTTFYSPWRDEQRPLRGVLHGIFVFRSIFDFYTLLQGKFDSVDVSKYLSKRKTEISRDFTRLSNFPQCTGLSASGQILASTLLLF